MLTIFNHTVSKRSSLVLILTLTRSSATLSAYTWIRRRMPSCSALTKRAACKPWSEPLRSCRCGPGIPSRQTHDYRRNGTTTLFAALNTLTGKVIERCLPRHRHGEFLEFLEHIDHSVPAKLDIHIIMDNYATHKHPAVKDWFARHPRYHTHFTPTSSSWLNAVERFFSEITNKRIRRGTFRSVRELEKAINKFVAEHNA
jgi:DDE superfamily endonuclease